jgi:hypothetical protein
MPVLPARIGKYSVEQESELGTLKSDVVRYELGDCAGDIALCACVDRAGGPVHAMEEEICR